MFLVKFAKISKKKKCDITQYIFEDKIEAENFYFNLRKCCNVSLVQIFNIADIKLEDFVFSNEYKDKYAPVEK